MPQPRNRPPQNILVTGTREHSQNQLLTPRTPHSRSGRAEEGLTEEEIRRIRDGTAYEEDDEDYTFLVPSRGLSAPLLVPPRDITFPSDYRSRGDEQDDIKAHKQIRAIVQRFLIISGSFMACGVLAMFMMALNRPNALHSKGEAAAQSNHSTLSSDPPHSRIISYENYTHFPLTGSEYRFECETMVNVTEHAGFWDVPLIGPLDVPHPPDSQEGTCSRTITYMLDGQVGLATDLALMAQVAGIARERNASFFIDDTHWNRGRWTDHFQDVINLQPGPQPGCKRPSPQELVACPRTARHWVVSSQTAAFHLTDQYTQTLAHSSAHALSRRKAMFDSAQESFKTVIQPNLHSQQLIRAARAEVMSILSLADKDQRTVDQKHEPYISVHISEGDHKHVQSSVDHPPDTIIKKYAEAARETWKRLYPHTPLPVTSASAAPDPAHFPSPPITYVASDSPEALRRFIAAFPSSTAIFSLDLSTNPGLRALAPQHAYDEEMFAEEDREQRVRLTRGTIVDLALASGLWAEEGEVMPGATICTRSSNMCEVAALGFDWNRAFGYHEDNDNLTSSQEKRRWVDLEDTGYGAIPQWLGFVLPHHDDL